MSEPEPEILDAEPVEEHRALVPAPAPRLAVTPTVQAAELVERLDVIRSAMTDAMQRDVDYGVIPGTDKPALFKPGAEKLSVLFQLDVQLVNEKHWGPGDHLTVSSHATVFHAPTGARLGYGEGLCTTRERKYAIRQAQKVCPSCNQPAVIKGKQEYGGGWLCFGKKGGCGAKWNDGAQEIEGQAAGEVENPDLPDAWNTVVKMAEKRARVDAVLAVTGASALFTQDVEDMHPAASASAPASASPARTTDSGAASDSQINYLKRLVGQKKPTPDQLQAMLAAIGAEGVRVEAGWTDGLSKGIASGLIDWLLKRPLPDTERPSDVPAPSDGEFDHGPVNTEGDPIPF